MLQLKNISLRIRIFLAMLLLVLLASVLMVSVTVLQYDEQTKDYNLLRFGRKEDAAKESIAIELKTKTTYPVTTDNLPKIFRERIYEISAIHKLHITLYDLNGNLLKTSIPVAFSDSLPQNLDRSIIDGVQDAIDHRVLQTIEDEGITYQTSYSYLNDPLFKPIGIVKLQLSQDNFEQEMELKEFLSRLSIVYFFMFAIAIALAYFLSSYITRSIKTITDKMKRTQLYKRNEKILLNSGSAELQILVDAYNNMIDELEESAVKLARSEREQAWREMAKQVAHEIKNPLTPMRLSVQSFERRFDENDPKVKEKLKEYSDSLIQQIDVMSSIASAFSDFAKMPQQKKEKIEVIGVVKMALDIFKEDNIIYQPKEEELYAYLDKTQLIRIVTNLIKNAIQATEDTDTPKVVVTVYESNANVIIEVADNGKGIEQTVEALVFEPKFTTKTSGMGLGLPMIKRIIEAYEGSIKFVSQPGKGTVFTVILPKT